jgi:threonine aldolase
MGGGMRQAGYLAAAGIYALENNIDRLAEDHRRASKMAEILQNKSFIKKLIPPETNILFFQLTEDIQAPPFLDLLKSKGILATAFGNDRIRLVFHLDIHQTAFETACQVFQDLSIR